MVQNFILSSKVFHKRHHPKVNFLNYRSYDIPLDMPDLAKHTVHSPLAMGADRRGMAAANSKLVSIHSFNIFSHYDKDHGKRDGSKSVNWATNLLV